MKHNRLPFDATEENAPLRTVQTSRRSFVIGIGAFVTAVSFGRIDVSKATAASAGASPDYVPNAWISIDSKGVVTITSPASEMGQGVMTSLPMLIAEEMDADWQSVRVVQAPVNTATYGNPALGGIQLTGGSHAMIGYYEKLRLVGAQTRKILIASAATVLGASENELATDLNSVVHTKTGRRLTFGEIAKRGKVPATIPTATVADLKSPDRWRYIGKRLPRIDVASKVNGTAKFGIDFRATGLLYGTVLRAPVQGERPLSIDDAMARSVKGIVKIVPLPYGVGIVAETLWAAQDAKRKLKVVWSSEARARSYSSVGVLSEYEAEARGLDRTALAFPAKGDAKSAIAGASKTVQAIFLSDHVHHLTMEPMNASACVTGDRIEIWAPLQGQTAAQGAAAKVIGTSPDKVAINTMMLGGGFGRRCEVDFVVDAVYLAKAVPGKHVKLIWSREDDVQHGKYRPLAAQNIQVGLDEKGSIVGWRHKVVGDSVFARYFPGLYEKLKGLDEVVAGGVEVNYEMPAHLAEYARQDRGVDVGFWRAIGPGYTKFAIESMIDEIAMIAGRDPIDYRLSLLADQPRARRVLTTVAEMADWHRKREGTGLGVAYSDAFGSHCAQIAEVSLDMKSGDIKVINVWCAVDPGVCVQPWNVEAQMMSGIIQGVSHALFEQINFVNGEVQESNLDTYRVLRMSEAPEIHVKVVPSVDSKPGGVGETGLPPVGPAIANAIAGLTAGRVRLRHYPFLSERVLAALKALPLHPR